VALALVALAVVGCGGDDEENGSAENGSAEKGSADPCGALSDSQVEKAIGIDFASVGGGGGKTLDGFEYRECTWESESGAKLSLDVITSPKRYAQLEKQLARAPGREAIAGVGEEAFSASGFSSEQGGGTAGRTVYARDGDRTVVVALDPGRGETTVEKMTSVARDALAGL
jgi:hypothetical protein